MSVSPQHQFSIAPQVNVSRSVFDRSHTVKTTFNEALLVPVFVDEVLPGDTFSLDMTALCRMATPIFPVMDNIYMDSFFFSFLIALFGILPILTVGRLFVVNLMLALLLTLLLLNVLLLRVVMLLALSKIISVFLVLVRPLVVLVLSLIIICLFAVTIK